MPRARKTKRTPDVPTCHSGQCPHHCFAMKPVSGDQRDRFACQIEFCPKMNNAIKKYRSQLPQLNLDGKEYTPCFILEGDEDHYVQHDEKYREAHNLKKGEYDDSNRTIVSLHFKFHLGGISPSLLGFQSQLEPKHGRKSKICAVCRIEYADYREHILSLSHKQRLRASSYNTFIEELVKDMQPQEREEPEPLESSDWSESTRFMLSQEEFISKSVRKDLKLREKDLERSTKWASGFVDQTENLKSSLFDKKDSDRQEPWQDKTFPNLTNKSFHIEDYLV